MTKTKAQLIFIICAFVFSIKTKAQIVIPNKDLEGVPCRASIGGSLDTFDYVNICALPSYFLCDSFTAIADSFIFNPPNFQPSVPYSGNTCLVLSDVNIKLKGSVSTKIDCSLKKNKLYNISYWASNVWDFGSNQTTKTFEIWGNVDTCTKVEKLWESEPIGIGWGQYKAVLSPKLQDYEYLHFRIGISSKSYIFLLDALSDIYPFNANDVTATIKDTTFTKPNTTCIELNATANITTYDTVYWQDAAGNKIADGFNGGTVCPDTSTYYIIAMRDSVPDCAGIWWSYDTVRVTVNTGTAVAPLSTGEGQGVRLFPNPATNTITIQTAAHPMQQISIYDINGKMLFTQQTNQTTQTQIALEGIIQTSGVYIAEITLINGVKHRAKFLKQ